CKRGLATSRLADKAYHVAVGYGECAAADRVHRASRGVVLDIEFLKRQDRHALVLELGEEDLLVAAADEEPGDNDEYNAQARRHEPIVVTARESLARIGVLQHIAPRDAVRRAETEERDGSLGQDRPADSDRAVEKRKRQNVGRHVHEQDAGVGRAGYTRGFHEGTFTHAQYLAANDARSIGQKQKWDAKNHVRRARPKQASDENDEGKERNAESHIGKPHQNGIDRATEVAGYEANQGPDQGDDDCRRQADNEGGTGA